VVHHAAGGYPEEMDASGVKAMMTDFLGAFSDLSYNFDLWVADGDLVVERYTATGTHDGPLGALPATGKKATWTGVNIFRLRCGRITEVWSEVDALSRNRQLSE
jgi:predicted ester cyclase